MELEQMKRIIESMKNLKINLKKKWKDKQNDSKQLHTHSQLNLIFVVLVNQNSCRKFACKMATDTAQINVNLWETALKKTENTYPSGSWHP